MFVYDDPPNIPLPEVFVISPDPASSSPDPDSSSPTQIYHNHLNLLLLILNMILKGQLDILSLLDGYMVLSILLLTTLHIHLLVLLLIIYPHICLMPPYPHHIFKHCAIFLLYKKPLLMMRLCRIHIGFKSWN